ncbi:MAG TPA: PhzF family phenazine biosynthesis protein [Solirubrobacteraceae bacterium]|nr:PhzF family phenazine biosynthesis protein [Solirubrobacteraceae bacterium]
MRSDLDDAIVSDARRYVLVDVFTEAPLQGNQLCVFTDARELSPRVMQLLGRELNLSETVFVLPPERGGTVRIRIFTPTAELPFAGHPVLGAAVVVASALQSASVTLETGVGLVSVELRREEGRAVFARMRQPVPSWRAYEREAELLQALGVERSGLPVELCSNGPRHVFVELESEEAVAALSPDMRALAELEGVCANCFAGEGMRWKTRMFAPGLGVAEDPATGSAAGPLAVHLSRHGRIAFGDEIEIRQGAEIGRPSVLFARAEGSAAEVEGVEVGGSAVVVARGEFLLPEGLG